MRYAVHTTAKPEWHKFYPALGHDDGPKRDAAGDCFYGWGEKMEKGQGCIPHTVLYDMSLEEARNWARILIADGYQVVVSKHEDWSDQIHDSVTPFYYRAAHQH